MHKLERRDMEQATESSFYEAWHLLHYCGPSELPCPCIWFKVQLHRNTEQSGKEKEVGFKIGEGRGGRSGCLMARVSELPPIQLGFRVSLTDDRSYMLEGVIMLLVLVILFTLCLSSVFLPCLHTRRIRRGPGGAS